MLDKEFDGIYRAAFEKWLHETNFDDAGVQQKRLQDFHWKVVD